MSLIGRITDGGTRDPSRTSPCCLRGNWLKVSSVRVIAGVSNNVLIRIGMSAALVIQEIFHNSRCGDVRRLRRRWRRKRSQRSKDVGGIVHGGIVPGSVQRRRRSRRRRRRQDKSWLESVDRDQDRLAVTEDPECLGRTCHHPEWAIVGSAQGRLDGVNPEKDVGGGLQSSREMAVLPAMVKDGKR